MSQSLSFFKMYALLYVIISHKPKLKGAEKGKKVSRFIFLDKSYEIVVFSQCIVGQRRMFPARRVQRKFPLWPLRCC